MKRTKMFEEVTDPLASSVTVTRQVAVQVPYSEIVRFQTADDPSPCGMTVIWVSPETYSQL